MINLNLRQVEVQTVWTFMNAIYHPHPLPKLSIHPCWYLQSVGYGVPFLLLCCRQIQELILHHFTAVLNSYNIKYLFIFVHFSPFLTGFIMQPEPGRQWESRAWCRISIVCWPETMSKKNSTMFKVYDSKPFRQGIGQKSFPTRTEECEEAFPWKCLDGWEALEIDGFA